MAAHVVARAVAGWWGGREGRGRQPSWLTKLVVSGVSGWLTRRRIRAEARRTRFAMLCGRIASRRSGDLPGPEASWISADLAWHGWVSGGPRQVGTVSAGGDHNLTRLSGGEGETVAGAGGAPGKRGQSP